MVDTTIGGRTGWCKFCCTRPNQSLKLTVKADCALAARKIKWVNASWHAAGLVLNFGTTLIEGGHAAAP